MDDALAIAGRVAIVTGAGNGLGRAESLALARAGALLVLNDLPGDAVQAVADEIAADGGQAVVAAGDVADWATGEKLLATALERYGRLDILVNNAGVLRDRMVFTMSPDEWDLVIRVHLRGHFVTTRLATAYWREQRNAAGHPVYARIVNTSSEAFLLGSVGQPNYAAAKAGIAALTLTTARSCSRYGVRANAICPRARTAMTAELMGPAPEGAADPLAPEHVAPLVVYLAGPAAETINGEVFVVHGGVAAVMDPPRVRSVFRAAGTPDGMWTLDAVAAALGPVRGRGFRGPGALGRVPVRGHARAGHRDHRVLLASASSRRHRGLMTDGQAAFGLAAHVQLGPVRGADGLGDRQAEAHAAVWLFRIRRNGSARVGTASGGTTGPLLAMRSSAPPGYRPVDDADPAARLVVPDRVVDEVPDHALDELLIAGRLGRPEVRLAPSAPAGRYRARPVPARPRPPPRGPAARCSSRPGR